MSRVNCNRLTALILLALATVLSPSPATAGLPATHWVAPILSVLADAGVASAVAAQARAADFAPDAAVGAGQWQRWLCQAAAWPEAGTCSATTDATPLPRHVALAAALPLLPHVLVPDAALPAPVNEHPAASVLTAALRAGLVVGDPSGRLDPDRPLTAAEAAVLAGRVIVNRQAGQPWQLEPERQTPLDRLRLRLHPELSGPHRYVRVETAGGDVVAAPVRVADRPVTLMVGAESGLGSGLLLMDTPAIHTRWGPVPLDVAFLNSDGRILGLYPNLPRGVSRGRLGAALALELPGGTADRLGLAVGQRLIIGWPGGSGSGGG